MWAGDARSINPVQCLKVGTEPQTLTVIVPNQGRFVAGVLTRYEQEWSNITDDPVTLQAIRGVKTSNDSQTPSTAPLQSGADRTEGRTSNRRSHKFLAGLSG